MAQLHAVGAFSFMVFGRDATIFFGKERDQIAENVDFRAFAMSRACNHLAFTFMRICVLFFRYPSILMGLVEHFSTQLFCKKRGSHISKQRR